MYKAIAFSLRAPYLQSQEGLEQRVVRAKSERRGFHDRQDCSLGFLGCSGGWSESTGAPQPPCTYSHTCMYTLTHTRTRTHSHTHMHTHPGFQRSSISVNIPPVVKIEGPTWHQSSGCPSEMPPLAGPCRSRLVLAWPLRPRTGPALKVLIFLPLSEVRRGLAACSRVRRPGLLSPPRRCGPFRWTALRSLCVGPRYF